jgi:replication-associated recombination protein RarA
VSWIFGDPWRNFFRKSFILEVYDVLAKRSHKFGDKVTDMTCLPDNLDAPTYYQPTDQSFEQRLCARLDEIRKLKSKSVAES